MRRDELETFCAVGSRAAWLLLLMLTLSSCTGGQSGNEGAGLDGPSGVKDAGPDGGADGPTMPVSGGAGAPNDFGNRDGAVDAEVDAGRDDDSDGGGSNGVTNPLEPALHGNDEVCADSSVDAPLDCLDVCGTLFSCDSTIACDDCLQHCAASPVGPIAGHRCLSRVVYLIDEEGCPAMVRAYQAYLLEASCGER